MKRFFSVLFTLASSLSFAEVDSKIDAYIYQKNTASLEQLKCMQTATQSLRNVLSNTEYREDLNRKLIRMLPCSQPLRFSIIEGTKEFYDDNPNDGLDHDVHIFNEYRSIEVHCPSSLKVPLVLVGNLSTIPKSIDEEYTNFHEKCNKSILTKITWGEYQCGSFTQGNCQVDDQLLKLATNEALGKFRAQLKQEQIKLKNTQEKRQIFSDEFLEMDLKDSKERKNNLKQFQAIQE